MTSSFKIVIYFSLFFSSLCSAQNKGFDYLKQYDYFKARAFFLEKQAKQPIENNFGLAIVYQEYRNFWYNLDAAFVCIEKSKLAFSLITPKRKNAFIKIGISNQAIDSLRSVIILKAYKTARDSNSIKEYEHFLSIYKETNYGNSIVFTRDSLAFEKAKEAGTSTALKLFLEKYSHSSFNTQASKLLDLWTFVEFTSDGSVESYQSFINQYPESRYLRSAEDAIYQMMTDDGKINSYHTFIQSYPKNANVPEAWNQVYQLHTKTQNAESFRDFKIRYPDFPYQEQLFSDLRLAQTRLYLVQENNLFGYIDSTGKTIIPFQFESAEGFIDNLAIASENKQLGYINKFGKWHIKPQFDEANAFQNNVAIVKKNNKFGIINRNGEAIAGFRFDDIFDFSEGKAKVVLNNKVGFIDQTGQLLIDTLFDDAGTFIEGFAWANKADQYFYVDTTGQIYSLSAFDEAGDFEGGFARVEKDDQSGIINKNINWIFMPKYQSIDYPQPELTPAIQNNKLGFIDPKGKILIPFKFESRSESINKHRFINELAIASSKGKDGLIDKKGNWLTQPQYQRLALLKNGFISIQKNNKWGLMNAKRQIVIEPIYDVELVVFQSYFLARKSGMWGIVDQQGKWLMNPQWNNVNLISNYLVVEKDKLLGLLDEQLNLMLNEQFETILKADGNLFWVSKNNKSALFHTMSKVFIWKESGFTQQ